MNWVVSIIVKILFKWVLTPKNVKLVLSKLVAELEQLAKKSEYTDIDDKVVEVVREALNL